MSGSSLAPHSLPLLLYPSWFWLCCSSLSLGTWGWHGLFAFRIRAQRNISAGTLERIDARFRLYRHCKVGVVDILGRFSQEEIQKNSYLQDVGLRHSADL